jgi:hypothetical protein
MSRFKNFFKIRLRKKKPVELEEPEYLKTLRENVIRGRDSENSLMSVDPLSSGTLVIDFDSADPFSPLTETAEVPQPEIPSVSVEEQALDEDSSVDEIYAHHIRAKISRKRDTSPFGKVVTITIVGQLKDGSLAWIGNDDLSFGHSAPDVFSPHSPSPGDETRAKVFGFAWGSTVGALIPNTFRTAEQVDTEREKSLSEPTDLAGVVPPLAMHTWKELLKPGDLVLAHVPFDGTYGTTKTGAISKNRPAMFVRWENDYALIRAIYGSGKHVDNNGLGTPLKGAGSLKKKSVIRNSEMDISVDGLLKSLGRLSNVDLQQLGYLSAAEPKKTKTKTERLKVHLRIVPKEPVQQPENLPFAKSVDPVKMELHNVCKELIRKGQYRSIRAVLEDLVANISGSQGLRDFLKDDGLGLAEIGTILHFLVGASNLDSKGFNLRVSIVPVLEKLNDSRGTALEISQGIHNLPVLRSGHKVPASFVPDLEDCTFIIPDDYECPDLVFLDQFAVADILGDNRLGFSRALQDVTLGENVPCLFVGPTDDLRLQQLHRAATHAGWICKSASTPASRLEVLLDFQREHGAQLITVISKYSDLVAELENIGCEVQILSEVCE